MGVSDDGLRVHGQRLVTLQSLGPYDRKPDQIGSIFEVKFRFDIGSVGFDRLDADGQPIGNRRGAQTAANQVKHLEFTVG